MVYDCIIVGLGAFGSSALYHLAKRDCQVIGLEQFDPVHDRGSSHGETRIIRQAYFEHPDYVPLLQRGYELWRDLEAESGEQLMVLNGLVLSGPMQGDAVPGALRSAREHGLSIEHLTSSTAQPRFPDFRFPPGHDVVYEAQAGYLYVERCLRTMLDRAKAHGAHSQFNSVVQHWSAGKEGVVVNTDWGRYEARSLLIAGGAWSGQLAASALPELRVLRKVQLWYPRIKPLALRTTATPAFYFETARGSFYGIPETYSTLVKVCEHSGGDWIQRPSHMSREVSEADTEPVDRFVRNSFLDAAPSPVKHAVCMYTMSPDGHFIIDQHPHHENVFFAAGFSGHGFKFATVLGEALADLVTEGKSGLPIQFLSRQRFQ